MCVCVCLCLFCFLVRFSLCMNFVLRALWIDSGFHIVLGAPKPCLLFRLGSLTHSGGLQFCADLDGQCQRKLCGEHLGRPFGRDRRQNGARSRRSHLPNSNRNCLEMTLQACTSEMRSHWWNALGVFEKVIALPLALKRRGCTLQYKGPHLEGVRSRFHREFLFV